MVAAKTHQCDACKQKFATEELVHRHVRYEVLPPTRIGFVSDHQVVCWCADPETVGLVKSAAGVWKENVPD